MRTILSQNTTDQTSLRAFTKLKATFPTWRQCLSAPAALVANAIREGGLADIKAGRIHAILRTLADDEASGGRGGGSAGGDLSLEGLRELPTAQVKAFLARFNGVGPKVRSSSVPL